MGDRAYRMSHRILETCAFLHGAYTGASDPISDEHRADLRKWLGYRLENWHASISKALAYDNAVRDLILATLAET